MKNRRNLVGAHLPAAAIVFFVLILSTGCMKESTAGSKPQSVERISAAEFVDLVTPTDVVLDVRSPAEYAAGHLQVAQNIDFLAADFREKVNALDRDQNYFLYCRSGNRSGQAQKVMKELGFVSVINIGGFDDLAAAKAELAD